MTSHHNGHSFTDRHRAGSESRVNRAKLRDSFCSITDSAAVTNPLSYTPTVFINFQLEIQTPKEGNRHLKVTIAAECAVGSEQEVRQCKLVGFWAAAKALPRSPQTWMR